MRLLICFTVAIFALCVSAIDPQGTRSVINRLVPKVGPVNGGNNGIQIEKTDQIDNGDSHHHQQQRTTSQHHHTGKHQNKVTKVNNAATQPPVKILNAIGGGGGMEAPSTGGSAALVGLAKRAHLLHRRGGKKSSSSSSSSSPIMDIARTDIIQADFSRQVDANPQGSHNKAATSSGPTTDLISKKLVGFADPKEVAAQKAAGQKTALLKLTPGSHTVAQVNPVVDHGPLKLTNSPPQHDA